MAAGLWFQCQNPSGCDAMVSEGETWVQQNGIGSLVCRRHKMEAVKNKPVLMASLLHKQFSQNEASTIPGREVEKFRDVK